MSKSAEAIEPGEGSPDHLAMTTEPFLAVDVTTGDGQKNTAIAAGVAAAPVIVALVGAAFACSPLRRAGLPVNARFGVEHFAIMDVATDQLKREWNSAVVRRQMPFLARLAAIL